MRSEKRNMIAFAHMMKTGGTSFLKMLIWHFGSDMLVIPGGLSLGAKAYNAERLKSDAILMNKPIKVLSGHVIRPYIDYGSLEGEIDWITFVRNPEKRYVSHYHHSINWDSYYRKNPKDSIMDWEKRRNMSNYQVRFLAGEENLQKAIDVLHEKIKWVGVTEKFADSCCSFKNYLGHDDFYIELKRTNSSLSQKDEINRILNDHNDFILEKNELDSMFYKYVIENIWPEQIKGMDLNCDRMGKGRIAREINFIQFQYNRQIKLNPTELNSKNIKRFYKRWLR